MQGLLGAREPSGRRAERKGAGVGSLRALLDAMGKLAI